MAGRLLTRSAEWRQTLNVGFRASDGATPVWLTDAARLLDTTPEALAAELIDTMLRSGAITLRDKRLHATAEHTPVAPDALRVPFPRKWPASTGSHHV